MIKLIIINNNTLIIINNTFIIINNTFTIINNTFIIINNTFITINNTNKQNYILSKRKFWFKEIGSKARMLKNWFIKSHDCKKRKHFSYRSFKFGIFNVALHVWQMLGF